MLLYLTVKTWTHGAESDALGDELSEAMDLGVHILLAHEMPGSGGQTERFGCEFGVNFACADGTTPDKLLSRNLYSEIAVPLKGGPWREASMALLGVALSMSKDDALNVEDKANVKRMLRQTSMTNVMRRSSNSQLVRRASSGLGKTVAARLWRQACTSCTAAQIVTTTAVSAASTSADSGGVGLELSAQCAAFRWIFRFARCC
jgi:hypothetical protein